MGGPPLDDIYPQCQLNQNTVTSITIPNGVVNVTCYNGKEFVFVASHVCDEGYQPNATSSVRVCRENGLWSGTTIACGEWLTLNCSSGAYEGFSSRSSKHIGVYLPCACTRMWQGLTYGLHKR